MGQAALTTDYATFTAVGVVLILLCLVLWRGREGTASTLQRGPVSGHSAVAFFVATMILYLAESRVVGFLGLFLALVVVQVQLEAKMGTPRHVACGAALGVAMAVLAARIFFPMPR